MIEAIGHHRVIPNDVVVSKEAIIALCIGLTNAMEELHNEWWLLENFTVRCRFYFTD